MVFVPVHTYKADVFAATDPEVTPTLSVIVMVVPALAVELPVTLKAAVDLVLSM